MGRRKKRKRSTVSTGKNTGKTGTGTGAEINASTGAGASETERVGVLYMSNEISVDEARLQAEADAALASAPLEDATFGAEGAPVAPEAAESWRPLVQGVVPMLRIVVFPQWNITDDEANEFTESLTQCMDQLFPGGMAGKYACWVRLMACCGGIVASRVIERGELPPLGPKRINVKSNDAKSDAGAAH